MAPDWRRGNGGVDGRGIWRVSETRSQPSPTPVSIAFMAGGLGDHRLEIISPVSGPTAGWAVAVERTAGARRRWRSPFAAAA